MKYFTIFALFASITLAQSSGAPTESSDDQPGMYYKKNPQLLMNNRHLPSRPKRRSATACW